MDQEETMRVFWALANYTDSNDVIQYNATRILLFRILSNVPEKLVGDIDPEQWLDILPHTDWALRSPKLRTNPMPVIRLSRFRGSVFGPQELLNDLSFGEFRAADEAFLAFTNGKSHDSIWLLFAILWRPERKDLSSFRNDPTRWNGDVREPFNKNMAVDRAKIYAKRLKPHYAVGALLYYWSARDAKLVNNSLLAPLFKGASNKTSKLGWLDPLLEMSGNKFGPIDQTDLQNWLIILVEMAREIERSKPKNKKNEKV